MKNENFKGAVVQGICAILAALLGVSGVVIWNNTKISNSTVNYNEGENIVNGDASIDNSTNITYEFNTTTEKEGNILDMARAACMEGDYDKALDLYKEREEPIASINIGYIYAHGLSYVGKDIQKAEEYYLKAGCIEADRNLFILYLENGMVDEAVQKCTELLWTLNDDITWDYIANCLYQKSWDEYQEETGCTKEKFSFDMNLLYEWEYIDNYYRGANPSSDTQRMRWILQGDDFEVGDGENHPYSIYRAQICVYAMRVEMMETMYYELNGKLYPLNV